MHLGTPFTTVHWEFAAQNMFAQGPAHRNKIIREDHI
jgi:hypothetical protein